MSNLAIWLSITTLVLCACSDTAKPEDPERGDAGDTSTSCSDIPAAQSVEFGDQRFCVFDSIQDAECPDSHRFAFDLVNVKACADSANADLDTLVDELTTVCEAHITDTECDAWPGCAFVAASERATYNGTCTQPTQPLCIFAPLGGGNVILCLQRENPETGETDVIAIDDVTSPGWEIVEQTDQDAACQCLEFFR